VPLADYLERKEPIVYVSTMEESRAEAEIQEYCDHRTPPMPLFRWSSTRGLERVRGAVVEPVTLAEDGDPRQQAQAPLLPVLRYAVSQCKEDGLFILKDVHQFLRSGSGYNPTVALTVRALREAFYELRALNKARKIVLLCPEVIIPPDLEKELRAEFGKAAQLEFFQSNHEGALIDKIGALAEAKFDGLVVNGGALTHTSVALRDALAGSGLRAVEVHISNVHSREEFRHTSLTAPVCAAVICGLGSQAYPAAVRFLLQD